ncbi:MAG: Ca2+/Na+ antiporter [Bacillariaceae sp.]|jgi:Ca2+/Na+ antiporter
MQYNYLRLLKITHIASCVRFNLGLLLCIIGLVAYMYLQLKFNDSSQNKDKRIAIAKKTLQEGKMSLKGIVKSTITTMESKQSLGSVPNETGYGSIPSETHHAPSAEILDVLKELLHDAFRAYDSDNNGMLEKSEIRVFLKDFHENIDEDTIHKIYSKVDKDNDNLVSLDEFVTLCYYLIMSHDGAPVDTSFRESINARCFKDDDDEGDDEVEDLPEEFTDLSPEDQQAAIKLRAFKMLFIGTVMVVYFSDPMVDVMQEIAVKCSLPPFYVSFILAPLASNSSEVIASMFYAAKKTRKTMTVSLSALEGAACMNNTFW